MIFCHPRWLKTIRENDIIAIFPVGTMEHRRKSQVIRVEEAMMRHGLFDNLERDVRARRIIGEIFLSALNVGLGIGKSPLRVIPLVPEDSADNVGREGELLYRAVRLRTRKNHSGALQG